MTFTSLMKVLKTTSVRLKHLLVIELQDVHVAGFTYNANHPFHLHGHPFRVVGMDRLGQSVTVDMVKALDKANLLVRNLTNPPTKDTVTVPDGGYTILRVHASNPGECCNLPL